MEEWYFTCSMPQFFKSFLSEDNPSPTGDNVKIKSKDSIKWFLTKVKGYSLL